MPPASQTPDPGPAGDGNAGPGARRLFVYSAGFLRQPRLRRILSLAGWQITPAVPPFKGSPFPLPGPDDAIGVWGHSPYAARGERAARLTGAPLVRIEDAFIRSLHPGRSGEPPLGLVIDRRGLYLDAGRTSDLEHLLRETPFDDAALLGRARDGIERLQAAEVSKYSAYDPHHPLPRPGYVLVIDQTRDDASIRLGGANASHFREMLFTARDEHPGARIVIKTHPETAAGHRPGHFGPEDVDNSTTLLSDPVSPWLLLRGAVAVYVVTSQMGFEAIMAGHRPHVFGQPFYAGWGLTQDLLPQQRRGRTLTRAQLFAGAMLLYPTWYDPHRDRLCEFETSLAAMEAAARAWRQDRFGHVAGGMRLWKRRPLQRIFGQYRRLRFAEGPALVRTARREGRPAMVWAGKATPELTEAARASKVPLVRVEDGFLRSRGLGAELVPPLSLVLDDLGIYYDPSGPSRLETLIRDAASLSDARRNRARALHDRILRAGLTKYNLGPGPDRAASAGRPHAPRILVPGQVEDDASILTGAGTVRTNLDLLRATRQANPGALILYKPHPDVAGGLRMGHVAPDEVLRHADELVEGVDAAALLTEGTEVWTMTSLLGFEALLRGLRVTCLGTPFYAGWGLTRDLGPVPDRRRREVSLEGLIHAALIDYPRYFDPVTGTACPPEVAVDRLAGGNLPRPGPLNRLTAKAQGALSSYAWLWR
ncbi:beta-3-deoxy-D-manno-oct-2-ulosonic acid transferase [Brevirhabdus pacifica]|uniref:Beta-3-deoxy-D-manno-oct-2-ulosonic acid transferase n=1 Tax=Brevirhabdus pacifica TaxID=1267768 RepID=A0A1U7DFY7_9RHOB|nr:capsular polysaccharide biosynthesis protein [Brevirhabdus pacifica]APX88876.1 beta-3-deoxy-D-manno-oct-2-ulosonic acid transferase [Brevirhabdus pacifica]OWU80110.1 capsular biosynthesis protein [Loktanella sp. 22II-4b]PJJ86582.1 capsular polysaccharide export protein [Brevirhabdus pacifica]